MEKSLKNTAVNYGLYLGLTLTLITVIAYAINLDLYTKIWFGLSLLALIIAFGIASVIKVKKLNGGYLSFKHAFTSYFIAVVVGITISGLVSIIIFNFIDPEAAKVLQEKIMDAQIERLESFNVPADVISETIEKMEAQGNMYSINNVLQSLVWQILGFSIVGLIVAAAMKKTNPDSE